MGNHPHNEPNDEFKHYGPIAGWRLISSDWCPTHVMRELDNGWAEWRTDYSGASESGVAQPGKWKFESHQQGEDNGPK